MADIKPPTEAERLKRLEGMLHSVLEELDELRRQIHNMHDDLREEIAAVGVYNEQQDDFES